MKNHLIFGLPWIIAFTIASAVPEMLPPIAALGDGKQFAFQATSPAEPRVTVTELTRDNVVYKYLRAAEQSWMIKFSKDEVDEEIAIFSTPQNHLTRLVDIKENSGVYEILFSHPQGYYYYRVIKEEGVWTARAIVSILQKEFLENSEMEPSVTSVKIEPNNQVVIKRTNKPDSSYSIDLAQEEVGGANHGSNIAYFRFRVSP